MPRPLRTRPVSIVQVRAYTGKAREYTTQEYADVAVVEIAAGRDIAATSLRSMRQSTLSTRSAEPSSASCL